MKYLQSHGGNRYQEQEIRFDFSVNTNPLGMPCYLTDVLRQLPDNSLYEWYPDPACGALKQRLAGLHGISEEQVLCGNGASELLFAIIRALHFQKGRPLRCILPIPSFGEYERALIAAKSEILYHALQSEDNYSITESLLKMLKEEKPDLLILCSPANPTGGMIAQEIMARILDICSAMGVTVLLDACFEELSVKPGYTAARALEEGNVIIVKAFTKLFAVAGLRLGYCMSRNKALIKAVEEQLPCWNVSGIAQKAGVTILDNLQTIDYLSQTRKLLMTERQYLTRKLEELGLRVLPGSANFICFYSKTPLYEALLGRGILIRDCESFRGLGKGWYRICVAAHAANEILINNLQEIL